MAFRRFVLENAPSELYAPYFGLCRKELRAWVEAQFSKSLSWDNFGKAWQFEHIIPVAWFDTTSEEELKACWNYLNIRVSPTDSLGGSSDLLFAKRHFEVLFEKTGFKGCLYYIKKLESIIHEQFVSPPLELLDFIQTNQLILDEIPGFSNEEYQQYLETESAKSILTEREILKKFG